MGVIYVKNILKQVVSKGTEIGTDFAIKKANEKIQGTKLADIISFDDPPENINGRDEYDIIEDFLFDDGFAEFCNSQKGARRLLELGYKRIDNTVDSNSNLSNGDDDYSICADRLVDVEVTNTKIEVEQG